MNDTQGVFSASRTILLEMRTGTSLALRSWPVTSRREKVAQEEIENMARFPLENPNPVLRIAIDGTILYANHGQLATHGKLECLVGDKVPDEIQVEIDSSWSTQNSTDLKISASDIVYSFMFVPILDRDYINLYGREITDLKNAQQSLILLNEELEARVEDRTRALKIAQEQLVR